MAAVDLDQLADVGLAFAAVPVATAAALGLGVAGGAPPAAQGFVVEVQVVIFGQAFGGQGRAEVRVLLGAQREDLLAQRGGLAAVGGLPAQPMHQPGITFELVAFPDAFALAVGEREQARDLHQCEFFLAHPRHSFQSFSFLVTHANVLHPASCGRC